MNNLIINN